MFTSCTRALDSGNTCKSPAVRGTSLCFNHTPHENIKRRQHHEYEPFELPPLHSKSAVLVAISEVLYRLSMRGIKRSEADTLLHGLSLVARLMTELDQEVGACGMDHTQYAAQDQQGEPSLESIREMIDSMAAKLDGPTFKEIEELQAAMPTQLPTKPSIIGEPLVKPDRSAPKPIPQRNMTKK